MVDQHLNDADDTLDRCKIIIEQRRIVITYRAAVILDRITIIAHNCQYSVSLALGNTFLSFAQFCIPQIVLINTYPIIIAISPSMLQWKKNIIPPLL